ncbi:MAG: hypothetical protein ABIH63_04260 [archaeon]
MKKIICAGLIMAMSIFVFLGGVYRLKQMMLEVKALPTGEQGVGAIVLIFIGTLICGVCLTTFFLGLCKLRGDNQLIR